MIPLILFLCLAGMLYAAVVETAFAVLMRLPSRLDAERARELAADHIGFVRQNLARMLRGDARNKP